MAKNQDYYFGPVTDHASLEAMVGYSLTKGDAHKIIETADAIFQEDLGGGRKIDKALVLALQELGYK